ncbi:MAG: hypothetical protein NTZ38_00845 [Candidatus Taylorbacteria bacterium]|nr:hypothetical protein [Candidatus Taylorbacteria bacterium]
MTSRDYFKGKRIAMIGLGPHGEMIDDARFLIKNGALLSIYDMRSEARLKSHLVFLRSVGLANYVCGSIPADDLLDMDLVVLSSEYPRDSSFLKPVMEKNIPIEYAETLFFKLSPPLTLVGVMGSCGKTTVVSMLAPALEAVCAYTRGHEGSIQSCFVVDPELKGGILPCLKKARNGDIMLMRMTGLIMRELYHMRISPHVAIFITVPPKAMFDESPFEILTYQTYNNFIIASDEVVDATRRYKFNSKAKMLRTKASMIPMEWDFKGRPHDRDNAALALQAARLFKVSEDTIQNILESWKPLKGRLELVRKVKNTEFYNDTASISPDATIVGMKSLSTDRNLVLIFGGAQSGSDYQLFYEALPQYAHTVILLPGSGTIRERKRFRDVENMEILSVPTIEEAVLLACDHVRTGDKVLFSPGFDAGGFDASRKERGERFVRAVKSL